MDVTTTICFGVCPIPEIKSIMASDDYSDDNELNVAMRRHGMELVEMGSWDSRMYGVAIKQSVITSSPWKAAPVPNNLWEKEELSWNNRFTGFFQELKIVPNKEPGWIVCTMVDE